MVCDVSQRSPLAWAGRPIRVGGIVVCIVVKVLRFDRLMNLAGIVKNWLQWHHYVTKTCLSTLDLGQRSDRKCTLYRVFGFTLTVCKVWQVFSGMWRILQYILLQIPKGCDERSMDRPNLVSKSRPVCIYQKTLYVLKNIRSPLNATCYSRCHVVPYTSCHNTRSLEVKSATHGYIIRTTWRIYIHVICKDWYWLCNIGARSGTCHNAHLPAPGG